MEQHHSDSAPVHRIPSSSDRRSSTSALRSSPNIPLQTTHRPSTTTTRTTPHSRKRTIFQVGDCNSEQRRKRSKPLQMDEFKLTGSESPEAQQTASRPPTHEPPTATSVGSNVHIPSPPSSSSFESPQSTPSPIGARIRARAMSAPDQSTLVKARQMDQRPAIVRRALNTSCCRKSGLTKSKKSLSEPPVNLSTLKELDLKEILNNPRLRHDVYFDAALHFRPNLDGQRGQKKKAQAEMYWENVAKECEYLQKQQLGLQQTITPRPQPKRLVVLLDTMREILLSLVPVRDQNTVEQVFDRQLIIQQLQHGLMDFSGFATWLASLLKAHCAPMRDNWVDDMVGKIKDGVTHESPRLLVEGLRAAFGILEAMKLDVANHQIRTLRPYLVSTAAEFEREHFQKRIHKGTLSVHESQVWFRHLVAEANKTEEHPDHMNILTLGLLTRLMPSNMQSKPPATFTFDLERLDAIRLDIREDVNMKTCLLLFRSLVSGLNRTHEIDQGTYLQLTKAIQAINGEEDVLDKWQHNSAAIALQIALTAVRCVAGGPKSNAFPDSEKVLLAESWLSNHLNTNSNIYRMIERKVVDSLSSRTNVILNAWARHKSNETESSPSSVMGFPLEPTAIPQRLAKILNLHWRVFEMVYLSAVGAADPNIQIDTP